MPFSHGSKAIFKLANGAGALTDISQYLTSVTYNPEADTAETSALGTAAKTYIGGMKDGSLSCEGMFDPALDAIMDAALANSKAFEFGPQGTTTGSVKYSGNLILTSYEVETSTDDIGSFSAEFQRTGDHTRGTFA